jgi:hypothetical protein
MNGYQSFMTVGIIKSQNVNVADYLQFLLISLVQDMTTG